MAYLFKEEILNIGMYQDQACMEDGPTIHLFDNDISSYSASVIRKHFDTAEKTANLFGLPDWVTMCVETPDGWKDLENYNDITDHPEEEQELQKWRVVVEQRNVFYEEARTAEKARRIAAEDRIWDENQSGDDTYGVEITVEEA